MFRYDIQSHVTENSFSGSSDDDNGYVRKKGSSCPTSEFDDSFQAMCDIYGQTPPRTRLNRKKRYMRQKLNGGETKSLEKDIPSKAAIRRRNTLDNIIFNEMCDKADKDCENEVNQDIAKEGSRKCKRTLKVLRGTERDLKLDMEAAYNYNEKFGPHQVSTPNHMKIETRNRFRSLRSKPVDVEERKPKIKLTEKIPITDDREPIAQSPKTLSLKERELFHDTFSFLIKLGSTERNCRRQISHEETRWQNELKDLIWLELQAHHADRSPMAQDEYLCKQREAVEGLLKEIMEYRYDPIASVKNDNTPWININTTRIDRIVNVGSSPNIELGICPGCLSMYCRACARAQGEALQQVEGLLSRLEVAEALYPSSQAFAAHYPLYKSTEFIGRVKAMCLWYNMTKHHRLKLQILGKLLMMSHTKKKHDDTGDSGISSRSSDVTDHLEWKQTLVRFEVSNQQDENSSPSDSNNSNNSSGLSFVQSWPSTPESSFTYAEDDKNDRFDFYLVEFDRQAYRKYIEDVLKTRGLRKSLNFLERLHTSVLRKARLTLEKSDISESNNTLNEEYEGDEELRRYGVWSPEARELNLPSYRAAFVFLSRVPLDVVHEFLRMRLEQKPEQPSPLSVRQLMRELREGLRIACIHRDRFAAHSCAAVANNNDSCENLFQENVKDFDESLKAVFEVYLDYLQQWVDMVQHDSFHKNLIMDEWMFVKSIAGNILNGYEIAGVKFCEIAKTMIEQVKEYLNERPREIQENFEDWNDDDWSNRFQRMFVRREWQGMFVEAREKVVKGVMLAKCLKRDIVNWSIFDKELEESLTSLKDTVMDLRLDITNVIENFQRDLKKIEESNYEYDRSAIRSRIREILHQAYRMGFDYHKETCKLFALEEKAILAESLVSFAFLWMEFVRTRCERGRGLRPRWANQGLEFLITVCEPHNTKHLTDEEFEELKTCMDRCISHVVGSASTATNETENLKRLPHSRASSPCHTRSRTASLSLPQKSKDNVRSPDIPSSRKSFSSSVVDGNVGITINSSERTIPRQERINRAIRKVECDIDERLKGRELIGQVTDRKAVDRVRIKARRVTFTWQRGIKIGQGRFGKVYTIVNNQTGELLAMKEVQFQPGDHRAIRRVAEELQIFEGIQYKHLVRYYGLEIHREEMLIFMEFCAEGTLESLVAGSGNGLPESLVRKYTHQLLSAVAVLHSHGIVHRDIKSANIFLTDEGNCLKLGDFGSAVQIKAHTTMPGELQGFVGTQAYMAPEVFMKSESSGHGRAADIWSVGCCVIEMASGRRPWSDYDSNYQIMFKVGMGETPALPKNISIEGDNLIRKCLQHDPKKRLTANALLALPFTQAYEDVNADLLILRQ